MNENQKTVKGHLCVGSSPLAAIPQIMAEIRGTRVLDVGCGCGVYGYLLRNKWQDTPPGAGQFQNFGNRDPARDQPEFLAGIDFHLGNVKRCSRHNIYDFLALASARRLPFPDNYFHSVLCIEVLEHLTKTEALSAIEECARVATQRVIVTVPKNALDPHTRRDEREFLKAGSDDPEVKEWIEAETHKCSFTLGELRRVGFRTGRAIRWNVKLPIDLVRRLWELHGPKAGQYLGVKELHKQSEVYVEPAVKAAPKFTDGFADYRY